VPRASLFSLEKEKTFERKETKNSPNLRTHAIWIRIPVAPYFIIKMEEKISRNAQENYKDTTNLGVRKNFSANNVRPYIDLKKEVFYMLNLPNNKKILDVACGYGDFLVLLKERGHTGELFGVDLSENFVKESKKSNQDINFSVANAESLPFEDETFDIVLCKHSLYHFDDIPKAIKEMSRVLKKEGKLVITLNSLANGSREKIEKFKDLLAEVLQINHLDNNKIINLENYHKYFNEFKILKEVKFFGYINLKEIKTLVDYMNTLKEFFYPVPSEINWKGALNLIEKEVQKEIDKTGSYKETWGAGVILMKK